MQKKKEVALYKATKKKEYIYENESCLACFTERYDTKKNKKIENKGIHTLLIREAIFEKIITQVKQKSSGVQNSRGTRFTCHNH